mmetsp:Transcript_12847/g.30342  ORF Transcript_12847/g.30342 Transcript_12847/m.30342 type:complete len:110 (-) Transcript_12847:63-392(-)
MSNRQKNWRVEIARLLFLIVRGYNRGNDPLGFGATPSALFHALAEKEQLGPGFATTKPDRQHPNVSRYWVQALARWSRIHSSVIHPTTGLFLPMTTSIHLHLVIVSAPM